MKKGPKLYEDVYQNNFSFGENWSRYLNHVDTKRVNEAKKSLKKALGELSGKIFVDVGCGSGIFSLAAFLLGAKEVWSLDIDKNSIVCVTSFKEKMNHPKNWQIKKISALDKNLAKEVPQGDVVYSWGVLHHTGNMKAAIANVSKLVKPDGLMLISIYNKQTGLFSTNKLWENIKIFYNASGKLMQSAILGAYTLVYFVGKTVCFKNPFQEIKDYYKMRGMRWKDDVVDWLGGYPYEYATAEEIINFVGEQGLSCRHLIARGGIACNDFLFVKNA